MKILSSELYVKDNKVYHEGNKPKPKDIGAAPETHTHNYASSTTPGGSAEHAIKATEDSLGQRIDKYIKGLSVSGRTITYTQGDGTTGTITTQDTNTDTKVTNTLNTTAKAYITGTTESATNTGTQVFDTNVYLDTTAGMLTATTFKGALQGNATTATSATSASHAAKLTTPRSINGTNFDGTTAITTANWGTARNIQIGNAVKSVNGSANVTWTLAEIGAAAASHGRHIPDVCETITDWNNATKNGWYMGSNATNSPTANAWYFGEVIAHNANYVVQTVYQFTASTDAKAMPKYIRAKMNGTWGAWTNVTVSKAVPSNAVFTDTNTWRGVQDNLTSTATDQSLSANQGKVLKGLIDGKAASSHTHNYAGSSSAGGVANSATKLATARSINGTNFDGTGNITTANWGTARTLTIGNTGKSVNGSGNVSWSLSEIGAAPAGYGLGTVCQDKSNQDCNNILTTGFYRGSNMTNKPSGCTQGWIYLLVMSHDNSSWVRQVAYDFGTASQVYTRVKQNGSWTSWVATDNNTWRGVQDNLTSSATDQSLSANQGKILKSLIDGKAASSHTHNYAGSSSAGGAANSANTLTTARTINGTSFNGSANITTANWGTARIITIGSTGKSVNGSGSVSWTLREIGAAPASHNHSNMLTFKSNHGGDWTSASSMSGKTYMGGWHGKLTSGTTGYISLGAEGSPTLDLMIDGDIYVRENSKVYHSGNKPTPSDIGAAASNHTHGLVNLNSEAFSGGNDLNTYNSTKTWVARTLNSTTNKPADYFTVVNFGANSNSNFQLAHSYANNSILYVRGRHDTSGNYTPWAKVYTDKNKPTASEIGAATSSSVGTLSSLKTSAKGNLVAAINEVFQSADSARSSLVSAIGSPLTSTDTLASIATKLQSKKQELGTAAAKVVNGVSSSTNLNTIVSTLNGYKPYVGRAHTLYVDFNGGKTIYIEPQKANGSTTMKQGSTWMAMIKDIHAKRDYCVCSNTSYGFPSSTKDANNAVSFEIDGGGTLIIHCNLYSSKTYKIMLTSINATYSEIDETESSSYYYVVKTLEEKDEEEGRKDEESNC